MNLIRSFFLSARNFLANQWKGAILGITLAWVIKGAIGGVIEQIASNFWINTASPFLFGDPTIKSFYFILLIIFLVIVLIYLFINDFFRSKERFEGFKISTLSEVMMKMRDHDIIKYQNIMDKINTLNQAHQNNTIPTELDMFIEDVEIDGTTQPRFTLIEEAK